MQTIYLDNAATTKVYDEVLDVMKYYHSDMFYNTSSAYKLAVDCEEAVKKVENQIMDMMGAGRGNVLFTSGGTESINTAILGTASRTRKNMLATTGIEHSASLNACKKASETYGHRLSILPVNDKGYIEIDQIGSIITAETYLVSFIHINNETGIIQDIKSISSAIKEINQDCLIHVDGVQAFGKIKFRLDDADVDFYSVSSHKIHGPKGVGALYVKNSDTVNPLMVGGGHQYGLRPGTVNSPGIMGFGKAAQMIAGKNHEHVYKIKEVLFNKIRSELDDVLLIGDDLSRTSPYILNMAFKNVRGETLLHSLENENIMVSTGSACSSKKSAVSHVLQAMGVDKDYIDGSIRLSFSEFTTIDEVKTAAGAIIQNVKRLRRFS